MISDDRLDDVAARFGLGRRQLATPVARGAMGEVTRLDTDRGSWAVKELFPWANTDNTDAEVELAEASVVAGVVTPAPRRGQTGLVVETIGDERYRVWEWADTTGSPRPPAGAEFAEHVGAIAATIHGLGLESVADQPINGRPVRCHNDLGPGNVALDARGLPVVLDWEHAGSQVPAQELGYLLVAWCLSDGAVAIEAARALMAGYRRVSGGPETLDVSNFTGVACATLNFVVGQVSRALTAADDGTSAFAVNAVTAYCRHPISQEALTQLIDASATAA